MDEDTILRGRGRILVDSELEEVGTAENPLVVASSATGGQEVVQPDASALNATIPPPTAFYHGQKAVTTAGTAEALGSTQALKKGVLVKALSTNTGKVYVGGEDVDSATGFELDFGDMTYIEIDDLAKVYVDAAEDGEGVSYVAS